MTVLPPAMSTASSSSTGACPPAFSPENRPLDNPRARWGAARSAFVRAAALAGAALLLACNASNGELFETEVTLGPLNRPVLGGGASGGQPASNPESGVGGDGIGGVGGAGSGGTTTAPPPGAGGGGGPRPPSPPDAGAGPASDAGGTAGAAGAYPPSDGSCGEQCVRNGGRCSEGACFFDCAAPDACATRQILCPPDRPCDVTCGTRSCVENVVCPVGSTCAIRCAGELSCAKEIICEGECDVRCSGARACRGGIGGAAVLLDLECSGSQSCGATVQCEGRDCRVSCSGAESCARVRIFAAQNTLVCGGRDSCGTDITCLGGRCSAECANGACANGVDCQALRCELDELEDEAGDD